MDKLLLSTRVLQTAPNCVPGFPKEVWKRSSFSFLEGVWNVDGRSEKFLR